MSNELFCVYSHERGIKWRTGCGQPCGVHRVSEVNGKECPFCGKTAVLVSNARLIREEMMNEKSGEI